MTATPVEYDALEVFRIVRGSLPDGVTVSEGNFVTDEERITATRASDGSQIMFDTTDPLGDRGIAVTSLDNGDDAAAAGWGHIANPEDIESTEDAAEVVIDHLTSWAAKA